MTNKQFAAALKRLDISRNQAGKVLGIARASTYRMLAGKQEVPLTVERLLIVLQETGVPEEWLA